MHFNILYKCFDLRTLSLGFRNLETRKRQIKKLYTVFQSDL